MSFEGREMYIFSQLWLKYIPLHNSPDTISMLKKIFCQDNCEKSLKIPTTDFEKAQPMTAIADQLLKFQGSDLESTFCIYD